MFASRYKRLGSCRLLCCQGLLLSVLMKTIIHLVTKERGDREQRKVPYPKEALEAQAGMSAEST